MTRGRGSRLGASTSRSSPRGVIGSRVQTGTPSDSALEGIGRVGCAGTAGCVGAHGPARRVRLVQAHCAQAVFFLLLSLPCDRNRIPMRAVGCESNVRLWTAAGGSDGADGKGGCSGVATGGPSDWSRSSSACQSSIPLPLSLPHRAPSLSPSPWRRRPGQRISNGQPALTQSGGREAGRRWFTVHSLQPSAVRCDASSGASEDDSDDEDQPAGGCGRVTIGQQTNGPNARRGGHRRAARPLPQRR